MPKPEYSYSDAGILQRMSWDEGSELLVIKSMDDVAPIIEDNKARFNEGEKSWTDDRDMVHAARIPIEILEKWRVEDGIDYRTKEGWQRVIQRLDEPDWRYLRTWPGRIGKRPTRSYPVTEAR